MNFLNHYNTVKSLVEKINFTFESFKFYEEIGKEEQSKEYAKAWVALLEIFTAMTGHSQMQAMSGGFLLGDTCYHSKVEEIFKNYEKSLLDAGLIEESDTWTDSQKMSMYEAAGML